MQHLKQFIREVPDFPKPGILFYDISTLFQSPVGFGLALDSLTDYVKAVRAEKLVGIESRGFVLAGALADRLDLPFALARKAGKLPFTRISEEYALEYGTDRLELHTDAISADERVLVVDDLIATGGTIKATCRLVERLGGKIVGIGAVIALPFLQFEEKLAGYDLKYLIRYDSE